MLPESLRHRLSKLSLPLILLIIIGLNIYWSLTLNAFGAHFQQVAGTTLLDLENVGGILSPQAAADHISTYTTEARSLYWIFFVLDNLMPPLVFGSFVLLWIYCLHHTPFTLARRIESSPLLLIPFGVGLFDILENIAFVTAISSPQSAALLPLQIGTTFVYLKAVCLFATFGLTPVFGIAALVGRFTRRQQQPGFSHS
jgi:hypothetical protein